MKPLMLGIVVTAMLAVGCGSSFKGVCSKAKECCAQLSACEEINKEGNGFEDRCGIAGDAYDDALRTYGKSECDKITSARDDLASCLSGVSCSDIDSTTDVGHVSRCDAKARAWCEAERASGDACGHDFSKLTCEDATASMGAFF